MSLLFIGSTSQHGAVPYHLNVEIMVILIYSYDNGMWSTSYIFLIGMKRVTCMYMYIIRYIISKPIIFSQYPLKNCLIHKSNSNRFDLLSKAFKWWNENLYSFDLMCFTCLICSFCCLTWTIFSWTIMSLSSLSPRSCSFSSWSLSLSFFSTSPSFMW